MKSAIAPVAFLLILVTAASSETAHAQGFKIGPHVGLNLDGTDLFVGLESQFGVPIMKDRETWGNLGFDYYPLIDHVKISSYHVDVLFPFALGNLQFYGGGGLAMQFVKFDQAAGVLVRRSESNFGLDIKMGWVLGKRGDGYRPFVEANQTLGAGSDFLLRGGVFLVIGGR